MKNSSLVSLNSQLHLDRVEIAGIGAFHFGARMYEPELGIFISRDAAEQDFYGYGYCAGNPIIIVDPDGNYWVGALIGAAVGAYAGGAMANQSFNPGEWNWESADTWFGMVQGGVSGAMMGSGIEDRIFASSLDRGNIAGTAYGAKAQIAGKGGVGAIHERHMEHLAAFNDRRIGDYTSLVEQYYGITPKINAYAGGNYPKKLKQYLENGNEIWIITENENGMKTVRIISNPEGNIITNTENFKGNYFIIKGRNKTLQKSGNKYLEQLLPNSRKLFKRSPIDLNPKGIIAGQG